MAEKQSIPKFLRGILDRADLERIADTVRSVEATTSGEIRVSIREKRHRKEGTMSLMDIALSDFRRLGMHNTKEGTGVLLFILFSERQLQILADKGIYARLPQEGWDRLAVEIASHFRSGKFADGICHGLRECGALLAREFPHRPDDVDELPDDVSIS